MQYISIEQFKKQPEEIQKVFLKWWKPSLGDLVYAEPFKIGAISEETNVGYTLGFVNMHLNKFTPLLTEGQLREFIEDTTGCVISVSWYCWSRDKGIELFTYRISFASYDSINSRSIEIKCENIFDLYWQLACQIAKESVK